MQLSLNKYKTCQCFHTSYKITDTRIYIYNQRIPFRVEADTHHKGKYVYIYIVHGRLTIFVRT